MRLVVCIMTAMTMIACMGPDQETLVDELRVMAIQAEPAEVQLRDFVPDENGEVTEPVLNIVIGDPLNTGYQLAIWPCTNIGEGCEERKVFEDAPSEWIQIVESSESLVTVPVVNNPLWGALLSQSPRPDVPIAITSIFALVCEPSVCTELQDALNGDWNVDRFSNPFEWIAELPAIGTSMAIKQLPVSNGLSDETRLRNPIMTPTWASDTPIVTSVDTPLMLSFEITLFQQDPDVASIFGYTTRGGFDRNVFANNGLKMVDLEPAERSVNWYAAEDTELGDAELFVIVEDGTGGTGLWIGEGTVE